MGIFRYKRMEQRTGMFVGLNKGFIVTKPAVANAAFRANKSQRKGRLHPRVRNIREVIAEICGLTPFERKMVELIKTGIVSKESSRRPKSKFTLNDTNINEELENAPS